MKILYIVLFFGVQLSFGQVGIDTDNPQSDLHISKTNPDGGSIQVDGGFRLGGNATTAGSFGEKGQVFTSKGVKANGVVVNASWTTPGKIGNLYGTCGIPNDIVVLDRVITDGDRESTINVDSGQLLTALDSLPNGGIVLVRNTEITTFTKATTLTVALPKAIQVIGKPFVIAFDGPEGSHNSLMRNQSLRIVVRASERNAVHYIHDLGAVAPKMLINEFPRGGGPADSLFRVTRLDNRTTGTKTILLYNVLIIEAVADKIWSFITPDCTVRNPN